MARFIKPCNGYLNSFYGPRRHPITGVVGTFHRGIDYTAASDETIYAAAAGKVRFVDNSPTRTGFGRYIIITHSGGYETLYAHLSAVNVRVNQKVSQGQKIGLKGTSGNSTGVHLHFEISKGRWNNRYTTNVDPLPFISDPNIKVVQTVLKGLGLYRGAIDGIHGSLSIAGTKKLQEMRGLATDGVPGRGTMSVIYKEKEILDKPVVETKPTPKPPAVSKPAEKPKEEEDMPETAVVINGTEDAGTAILLAFQLGCGVYFRKDAEKKQVAKEIYIAGGGKGKIKGDKLVDLSGKTRSDTAKNVTAKLK